MKFLPKNLLIFILFLWNFLLKTYADLPIHCLKSQTTGKWRFEFTAPQKLRSPLENTCGHSTPDNEKTSFRSLSSNFPVSFTMTLKLLPNNCVEFVTSSENMPFFRFKTKKTLLKGHTNTTVCAGGESAAWTMVYDEGFEIRYKGVKLFAFSHYFPINNKYKSNCSKTCVGWYHNTLNKEFGCFRGEMIEKTANISYISDQTEQLNVVQGVVAPKTSENTGKPEEKFKENLRFNFKSFARHKFADTLDFSSASFKEHTKVAQRINSLSNTLWTADVDSPFKAMTLKELNLMAGRSRRKANIIASTPLKISRKTFKEDVSDLPRSFSWEQYLSDPGEQGPCGSCYAISTLKMLESRLRIHEKIDAKLSIKWAVLCSYYNQGCDGGYSFLLGRFGEENVFLDERTCNVSQNTQGICSYSCDNSPNTFKIKDYWYIGGSYGECNERKIMQEIMKNGPVVLSFEPDYTFMLYKTGIYHKPGVKNWTNSNENKPEWLKVDHSVLCYGWGEENGQKFWLLMNSWGKKWGEKGLFRMKRGEDELGIEFIGESAMPYAVKSG